mgnify:CR=1 FL=1
MCIRDRLRRRLEVLRRARARRRIAAHRLADQRRAFEPHLPVSYTHLRAHETVLDLVCRLLLEKKKRYITRHHVKNEHYHTINIQLIATPNRDKTTH